MTTSTVLEQPHTTLSSALQTQSSVMLPFFVQACEFGTLRFFAKSDFQNGRPTEVMQRASLKELSAFVSSCIRFIQPDVCVCDLNLREIQFRQYHFFLLVCFA